MAESSRTEAEQFRVLADEARTLPLASFYWQTTSNAALIVSFRKL